jgi:periodic tryptophan protein 1
MSGTLISAIAWVRGRAALEPKKYELNEAELERVGKLGGPGVLEQLKEQMEKMEMEDEGEGGRGRRRR